MATNYQRGRAFEYRVRNKLLEQGAVYVMRAAQSKGKVDLLALFPGKTIETPKGVAFAPRAWLVQCKLNGKLGPAERTELIELATQTHTVPVHAHTGPKGRGVVFTHLTQKETSTG